MLHRSADYYVLLLADVLYEKYVYTFGFSNSIYETNSKCADLMNEIYDNFPEKPLFVNSKAATGN